MGGVLVDQTSSRTRRTPARRAQRGMLLPFYLGCAAVLWPWWILMNAVGAFAGKPNCPRRGNWTSPFHCRSWRWWCRC